MKVLNTRYEEHEHGIPLSGIDNVKATLKLFSDGSIGASHDTSRQLIKDGGGMIAVLKSYMESGAESGFLKQLFDNMEVSIKGCGSYYKRFDYDGVGSFFKTTVEVKTVDKKQELYLLSLNAAYVGDKVEKELAESLGVERGLQWIMVGVEIEPVGNRFVIDFSEVIQKLKKLLTDCLSDKEVASRLMPKDKYYSKERVVLATLNGYDVGLWIDDVDLPFNFRQQADPACSWTLDGVTISGQLDKDWEDKTKFLNPVVEISIYGRNDGDKDRDLRMPILDSTVKGQVRELANRIVTTFKS